MFDTRELRALIVDMGKLPGAATKAVMTTVDDAGGDLAKAWKDNARATSGTHAHLYPDSISSENKGGGVGRISVEVGPEAGRGRGRQGSLGPVLEYGSPTSPPHLDGNRAADAQAPAFERKLSDAVAKVFGDIL